MRMLYVPYMTVHVFQTLRWFQCTYVIAKEKRHESIRFEFRRLDLLD